MEEESIKKQQYANGPNITDEKMTSNDTGQSDGFMCNNNKKPKAAVPQLRLLHELRAETYNGMVRMLKPGCRTIVVLVDAQSKNKLLPEFHRIVWPYRKYVLAVIIALRRTSMKCVSYFKMLYFNKRDALLNEIKKCVSKISHEHLL
jgi:hypothetical protein